MTTRDALWALALAATWPVMLTAQPRCDCMTVVDSCAATVVFDAEQRAVMADAPQCARVDYFVDGLPFVAVIDDGPHREPWLAGNGTPRVVVQSCQVCLDRGERGSEPAARTEPETLEPLIAVAPTYPPEAQQRGIDGRVEVEFTVDADGKVDNASVVAAEPAGLFDAAALAAVRRWRYPAEPDRAPQRITRSLEFDFDSYVWQLPRAESVESPEPARTEANQCVRQGVSYAFDGAVEVGMINACADPLAVYGCAEGVGTERGRWSCTDSGRARRLLVAEDDPRLGRQVMLTTGSGGARSAQYLGEFGLLRAPNSQLWWTACREQDQVCQQRAEQWVRALDGQTASIDPRHRTELTLARAF